MTEADWRALIEAYLDGRISAEAFARRFLEAFAAARAAGRTPPPVVTLHAAVEAFAAEAQGQDEGAVNDDALREAARRAENLLREQPPAAGARTYDRFRAREEIRRFQMQMTGCAGLGCIIALAWVALCVLQIYYVSEEIQLVLDWGAWPSAVLGFFLAFVPIIGNVLAFLGATHHGWHPWIAALVFFAAPAATMISGWMRWRRYRG